MAQKYAGVTSWKKLAAIAERWNLTESDGVYLLARDQSDSDGVYWGGKEKITIPSDATSGRPDMNAVIDAILSDTRARRAKRP